MNDFNNIRAMSSNDKQVALISNDNLYIIDLATKNQLYTKNLPNNGIFDCDFYGDIVAAVTNNEIVMINIKDETEFRYPLVSSASPTKYIINHNETTGEFVLSRIVTGDPTICTKTKFVFGKVFGEEKFIVENSDFALHDKTTSNLYTFGKKLNTSLDSNIGKTYDGNTGELISTLKDSKNTRLTELDVMGYTIDENFIYAFATYNNNDTGEGLYVVPFYKPNKNNVPTILSESSMPEDVKSSNADIMKGRLFEYNGTIYSFDKGMIYKYNSESRTFVTYADITSKVNADAIFATCSPSGMATIVCAKGSGLGSVSFDIVKFDIVSSNNTIVETVTAAVEGAAEDLSNVVFSRKPMLISDKFVVSATSKSTVDQSFKPVTIYINIKTKTAVVSKTSSASAFLKSKDSLEFFGEDVISFAGDNNYSDTASKSLNITSTKEPLNGDTASARNWRFVDQDNVTALSMGPLFKSGSKVFGQFIDNDDNTEVVLERNGVSIYEAANFTIPLKKKNSSFGNISSRILLASAPEGFKQSNLDNDILLYRFNKAGYVPLENEADPFAVRAIQPVKSPVADFEVEDYMVKVYSGSTSDLFITHDKTTGKTVDSLNVERGYGNSISNVSVSDESILIMYENSPSISSLIIHSDGKISLKMYNGEVYGKKIDDNDNSCTIQELDLTLLFDNEMSELGMRR